MSVGDCRGVQGGTIFTTVVRQGAPVVLRAVVVAMRAHAAHQVLHERRLRLCRAAGQQRLARHRHAQHERLQWQAAAAAAEIICMFHGPCHNCGICSSHRAPLLAEPNCWAQGRSRTHLVVGDDHADALEVHDDGLGAHKQRQRVGDPQGRIQHPVVQQYHALKPLLIGRMIRNMRGKPAPEAAPRALKHNLQTRTSGL